MTYGLYQELYVTRKALEPSSVTSTENELKDVHSKYPAAGSVVYWALGVDSVR